MSEKRSTIYEDNYFIYNGKLYKSELDYEVKTDNVNCKTLTAADSTLTTATIGTLNTTNLDLENSTIDTLKVDNIESKTTDANININSNIDATDTTLTISNIKTPSITSGTEYYRTNINNKIIRTGSDHHYTEINHFNSYPFWIHGRGYHNKQKDSEILLVVNDTKTIIQPGYINLTNKLLTSNAEIRSSLYGNATTVNLSNATATFLSLTASSLKGDQLTTKTIQGTASEDDTETTNLNISSSNTTFKNITAYDITTDNQIIVGTNLTVKGSGSVTGTFKVHNLYYDYLTGTSFTTTDINAKGSIYCINVKGGLNNDSTITVYAPKTVFNNEIYATTATIDKLTVNENLTITQSLQCSNLYGLNKNTPITCQNTLKSSTINFDHVYSTNGSLITFHNGIYSSARCYYDGQIDKDSCIVNKKYVDNAVKSYTPTISTLENLTISKSLNVDNIYPQDTTLNAPITLNAPVNITGKATLDYSTFTEDNQIITKSYLDNQLSNYPPQSYLDGVVSTINSKISTNEKNIVNLNTNINAIYEKINPLREIILTINVSYTTPSQTYITRKAIIGYLCKDYMSGYTYYIKIPQFDFSDINVPHDLNDYNPSIVLYVDQILIDNKEYIMSQGFIHNFSCIPKEDVIDYKFLCTFSTYNKYILANTYSVYLNITGDDYLPLFEVKYSADEMNDSNMLDIISSKFPTLKDKFIDSSGTATLSTAAYYSPVVIPSFEIPLMPQSKITLNSVVIEP